MKLHTVSYVASCETIRGPYSHSPRRWRDFPFLAYSVEAAISAAKAGAPAASYGVFGEGE